MRKISEIQDGDAIDLLADILEPMANIFSNEKVMTEIKGNGNNKIHIARVCLKECKNEIIEILAALKGIPKEEYHANIVSMLADLMELINDHELMSFFQTQALMITEDASMPVMEVTQAKEP